MQPEEIKKIISFLIPTDAMLEWGAGGSTHYFSQFVSHYYSIEHDKNWYSRVLQETTTIVPNFTIFLCEPNTPRTLPTQDKQFKDYINYVNTLEVKKFDKVLIDGRARVACAKEVLPYLKEDSIVFIHDWIRKRYHKVLEWYNIIDSIESPLEDGMGLAALKKKERD